MHAAEPRFLLQLGGLWLYRIGSKLLKTPFLHQSLVMGSTSFLAKAKTAVRVRDRKSCFLLFSAFSMDSADTFPGRLAENSSYLFSGSPISRFRLKSLPCVKNTWQIPRSPLQYNPLAALLPTPRFLASPLSGWPQACGGARPQRPAPASAGPAPLTAGGSLHSEAQWLR